MLRKSQLPLLIFLAFLLNGIIFWRAYLTIEDYNLVFAECARNSGRTSAVINLLVLFMLGYFGLKAIYKEESKKNTFRILMSLFTINHLIHFFFVFQNFRIQSIDWDIPDDLHPFFTFISLILMPILLWAFKNLNKWLYFGIIIHLFNLTYLMIKLFYGRVKPIDPAYTHRVGVVIMISALLFVLVRVFRERNVKLE